MKINNTIDATCQEMLRRMDQPDFASDPGSEVRLHLGTCEACAREFEARQAITSRLRSAVKASADAPPFLATRIMAKVRETPQASPYSAWMWRRTILGTLAAALVLTVGLSTAWQLGHLRMTVASQDSYIASLIRTVSPGMRPGLADHLHCAVYRKYPKNPPPFAGITADAGPIYRELVEAVNQQIPAGFKIHEAHRCAFEDRKFFHVVLRSDSQMMSVLLSKKLPGETLSNSELLPVIQQGGVKLYGASAQRYRISGFEQGNHLAFVVGDVSAQQTRQLLLALAPAIGKVLPNASI